MENQIITTKIRVITPSDGMAITDGETYSTGSIFLAYGADASKWHEIPESEIPSDVPQSPRTFRKSYLAQWIRAQGKWDDFENFLNAEPNFEFLWTYSTEFDENNPMWPTAINGVQIALNLTNEEVKNLLEFGENGN